MALRLVRTLALAAACSWNVVAAAPGVTVQLPGLVVPPSEASNKQKVVDVFVTSWNAYKEYAYGHDDLTPVSMSFVDSYGGWGASIVDALDTSFLMGETSIFEEAVEWSTSVDYNISSNAQVSVFETTIRYIGAMLVAYQLSGEKYPELVSKSVEVANKLSLAFDGSSPIHWGYVDFNDSVPITGATSNIAEQGTLTMEWVTLSNLTGNQTYADLALGAVTHIISLAAPLPGLPAQGIDPATGDAVGAYITWGGGSDSYFEYLIKYARLSNTDDNIFADTWATAVDTSMKVLAETSTVGDWQYLADWDTGTIIHIGSHLECYSAGNWLLGGKLLKNETIVNFALKHNDACWNTYASTATGIGPEAFAYFSPDGNYTDTSPSSGDIAFYERNGFFIQPGSEYYYMRPEVLESNFYAWRITGDTKYLTRAAAALDAFEVYLAAPVAYAGIDDVDATDSAFIDDMQSFWFAEVLKYLYLTFDDPSNISLDEYVFNTEGHPFKAPAAKSSYGSGSLQHPTGSFKVNPGTLPQVSPVPRLPNFLNPGQ
ncbi:glycoside hydrolase family 47 protein [Obba rivulosa]|uniref:alpha-1,2-Mannosidase n=1 Tax=Obba rivulosa TaxID=1052685 RepID=A0A8E2AV35_9APHY|nr:glycoside hydrolase family 47 protein [Obba rivulosa]